MLTILARAANFKQPFFSVDVSVFVCVSLCLEL